MDDAVNNYSGHQSKAHPLPVGPAPRRTPMGFQRARPNTWSPSARDISHVPLDAEQANIADEILSGLQLAVVDACNQAAVRFAPALHQPLEGGSLQTFDGQTGAVSLMSDPQTSTDNAATTATFLALADQLDLGQLQPKTTEPSDYHDPVLAVVSALAALSPRTKVLSGVSPSLSERMLCSAVKSLSDHADQAGARRACPLFVFFVDETPSGRAGGCHPCPASGYEPKENRRRDFSHRRFAVHDMALPPNLRSLPRAGNGGNDGW